jgi:hypothetical protein
MPDIFVAKEEAKKETKGKSKKGEIKNKPTLGLIKPPKGKAKHKLPGYSHNPLAAYSYFPDKVNFETRDREEKIILLLRRHPITNVRWIATVILMTLIPLFLIGFPILSILPVNFQVILFLSWYLVTTAYALENFLSWFFNVNIITDERIVDIDFYNLIYKEVSDTNIDRIQDVTYKMGGAVRTIFNYGDVLVQTAAEVPNFDFLAVPNPHQVVKILQELRIEEEIEKLEGRVR